MNWGGFASGLTNGFNNGVQMGKTVGDLLREGRLQTLREEGLAEANAARTQQINSSVTEAEQPTAAPTSGTATEATTPPEAPKTEPTAPAVSAASPTASPDAASANTAASSVQSPPAKAEASDPATTAAVVQPTASQKAVASGMPAEKAPEVKQKPSGRFSVKGLEGKTFDTREEAMAEAEKLAPSASDLFLKNAVPKMVEAYIANGDIEKAKAFQDFADGHNGKRLMKDWAAAFTAPDFDTAVSRFGKFYTDHIDDGVDFTGHKMKVNADGTKVAVVTLKNKATGKETDMELTRDKMLALAGQANPQKLFELEQSRTTAAEKAKLEAKIKAQQRSADNSDKMELEGYKQDRLDQREQRKSEYDNKFQKAKSDDERAHITRAYLAQLEPTKWKKMSEDEKAQATAAEMRSSIKAADIIKGEREAKKQIASGSQEGKTPAEAPKFSDKATKRIPGQPVYKNNETGKLYHKIDGVMTPIEN